MTMAKIAFLGLGAMGSRMCMHLIRAEYPVRVWNRDGSKALSLQQQGAIVCDSPRQAAEGADVVFAMLRDDDASRVVWLDTESGAFGGMQPGVIAVECSTLTVGYVRQLHALAAHRGIGLLDCPVIGSRPQADAGQLVILMAGDDGAIATAKPLLAHMGSTLHYAGRSGAATAVKLAVNALLGIQAAAMAEIIGMLDGMDVDTNKAVEIIGSCAVASPAAKALADAMLAGQFLAQFPVNLLEKDLGYVAATARAVQQSMPVAAAAQQVMQEAIAAGLGEDNMTGIVRLYRH